MVESEVARLSNTLSSGNVQLPTSELPSPHVHESGPRALYKYRGPHWPALTLDPHVYFEMESRPEV